MAEHTRTLTHTHTHIHTHTHRHTHGHTAPPPVSRGFFPEISVSLFCRSLRVSATILKKSNPLEREGDASFSLSFQGRLSNVCVVHSFDSWGRLLFLAAQKMKERTKEWPSTGFLAPDWTIQRPMAAAWLGNLQGQYSMTLLISSLNLSEHGLAHN